MRKGSKHKLNYRGSPEERFWKYVKKENSPVLCWNWNGTVTEKYNGCKRYYGLIRINQEPVKAHRFSYELHIGKIPKGLFVCHSCDNSLCVNPTHLFLGTNQDNVGDMVKKMRHTFGERNGQAKLTDSGVLKMRALRKKGATLSKLSSEFGVAISTVSQIINNLRWKHLLNK